MPAKKKVVPVKKKVVKSSSAKPPCKKKAANRPAKLRAWSDESMLQAMEAVKSSKSGINQAALDFGVRKTTLKNRLSGIGLPMEQTGPKPYLTQEEESELVSYLVKINVLKWGMAKREVKC